MRFNDDAIQEKREPPRASFKMLPAALFKPFGHHVTEANQRSRQMP